MERQRDLGAGPTRFHRLIRPVVLFLLLIGWSAASAQEPGEDRRRVVIELPLLVNGTQAGVAPVDMADFNALEVSLPDLVLVLADTLSQAALEDLDSAGGAQSDFVPVTALSDLTGLDLRFDNRSAALVLDIPMEKLRPVEISVRREALRSADPDQPARRSAFLNVRLSGGYVHASDFAPAGRAPTRLDLDGAARVFGAEGPALVAAGTWREDGGASEWRRGDVFVIHDDLDRLVRLRLGDLRYATAPFQGSEPILGLAVEREYDALTPSRLVQPGGRYDFTLERTSLVQVFLNGALLRTLRLRAGRYDVRDFAFFDGANEIEIVIEDDAGRTETLSFSAFSDKALLSPGLSEFTYAVGAPFDRARGETEYDFDRFNASFRHRFGVTDHLTAALDGQSDASVRQLGAGLVFAGLGGAVEIHAAASETSGVVDAAAEAAYEVRLEDFLGLQELRLDVAGDYVGPRFSRIGDFDADNAIAGSASSRLPAPLPGGIYASAGARYEFGREGRADSWGANATFSRPFGAVTALVSLTADRAFDEDDTRLGAFVSLSARLGRGRFARARYDSLSRATIIEAIQPARSRPGALGWTAGAETRPGAATLTGEAAYVANRFEAEASHELNYADPGLNLTEQRTRANLSFSIAAADGVIAVGRPVGESFAIVRRHPNLSNRALDIEPEAGRARASAGALGPALLPDLSSYRTRVIEYDVEDLPPGYDLGRGAFEVRPPVFSGYALRVGSDAAATAMGAAFLPDGRPVSLAGARVVRVDGTGEPVQVFTNRTGRFVAAGLSAGRWRFEVDLGEVYAAEFTIPSTAAGLVEAGDLQLVRFEEIRS
mgnify:CR=1 FL=1